MKKQDRALFYKKHSKESMVFLISLVLLTAFMGQIYFRPFSNDFRFSLSIPTLSLILLFFPMCSSFFYSSIAGITMVIFRTALAFIASEQASLSSLLIQNMPSLFFYLTFGALFFLFRVRDNSDNGVLLFLSLWICEILSNLVELTVLNVLSIQPVERAVSLIIIVGVLRSGCTAAIFRLAIHFHKNREKQQREEHYEQMLIFFSTIKTDLLFFNKSMEDIEKAMKYSYDLYEELKESQFEEASLSVARQIHEIKKDYQRITGSMEKAILEEEYKDKAMNISQIFAILQKSTDRLLLTRNQLITVSFNAIDDWEVSSFYTIISIVNNLVINALEALEAIEAEGKIVVTAKKEAKTYSISIWDNGPGIEVELMEYIFEPGFTTKYNSQTGKMSTGIGLAHVKHMIDTIFGGDIIVSSNETGTLFSINLPV